MCQRLIPNIADQTHCTISTETCLKFSLRYLSLAIWYSSHSRTDPTNKQLSHKEDFQVKIFFLLIIIIIIIVFTKITDDPDEQVKHYAGDVIYNISGFIEKNRDTLFQDFKRLLFNSKNPVTIMTSMMIMITTTMMTMLSRFWGECGLRVRSTSQRPQRDRSLLEHSSRTRCLHWWRLSTQRYSWASDWRFSKFLKGAALHPVHQTKRCKVPGSLRPEACWTSGGIMKMIRQTLVLWWWHNMTQVAYLGLLENVRVRRAGFAYRQEYWRFLRRSESLHHGGRQAKYGGDYHQSWSVRPSPTWPWS